MEEFNNKDVHAKWAALRKKRLIEGGIKVIFPFRNAYSSEAISWWVPLYEGKRSDNWFFWWPHKIFRQLHDAKYWFKYRFVKKHRYHIVELGLKPDYYELDTRMREAVFTLLYSYVEKELGPWGEKQILDSYYFWQNTDFPQTMREVRDHGYRGFRLHFVGNENIIDLYWEVKSNEIRYSLLEAAQNQLYSSPDETFDPFVTTPVYDEEDKVVYYKLENTETEEGLTTRKKIRDIDEEMNECDKERDRLLHEIINVYRGLWT